MLGFIFESDAHDSYLRAFRYFLQILDSQTHQETAQVGGSQYPKKS